MTGRTFFRGGGLSADRVLAMSEQLELTDAQEEQIREARRDHRRAQIEREAQIELAGLDLREMMEDLDAADLNAIESAMQRRAELRVQDQMANLRLSRQVRDILTEEQREMLPSSRRNVFMLRGDGPHALMQDHEVVLEALDGWNWDGDFDFDFDFDDHVFELHGEDAGPMIYRYHLQQQEEKEGDDDEVGTEGTAVGEVLSGYTPIHISL